MELLIFLLLTILFSLSLEKYLEIPYHSFFTGNQIVLYLENTLVELNVYLDLSSQKTWISYRSELKLNKPYPTDQIINDNITVTLQGKNYKAKEIKDSVMFETNSKDCASITFYLIDNNISEYSDGALGFGYHFKKEEDSIIYMFYKKGLISSQSFSFSWTLDKLVFGGTPDAFKENRTMSYCDVIGKDYHWDCYINAVRLENGTKIISYLPNKTKNNTTPQYSYLTSYHDEVLIPRSFMTLLINEYYFELIKEDYVRAEVINNETLMYYEANFKITHGSIIFTLGDYSYRIDMARFWSCYEIFCTLNMNVNPDGDFWVLGLSFYQTFNVEFNYEKNKIFFFSKNDITKANKINIPDNNENSHIIFKILVCVTSVLFVGSLFNIFILTRKVIF